jgi:A/G-specific adenine glycosylase
MDLGATVCTRTDPACVLCPMQDDCIARIEGLTALLPESRPGKPMPTRHCVLLVARDTDGRVLLQRRPEVGVWAGLWSLPEAPDHDAARLWVGRNLAVDFDHADVHPEFDHVFSHFRLRAEPLLWRNARARPAVGDNHDLRWTEPQALAGTGLPAPIRKLLDTLLRNDS